MNRSFVEDYFRLLERFRDRVAVVDSFSDTSVTYRQLAQLVENFGARLLAEGITPGSLIASVFPGGLGSVVTFLASLRFGYDYLPLSSQSTTPEITRYFNLLKPQCLVTLDDKVEHEFFKILDSKTKVIRLKDDELKLPETSASVPLPVGKAPQSHLFLATSGSTGTPKVLRLNGDRLWSAACAFSSFHDFLDENTRFFNFYPMSYLAGLYNLTLIPMSVGASMVLGEGFTGLSLMKFWTTVKRHSVNVLWFSPTVLHGLAACNKKTPQLCPPEIAKDIRAGFLGMGAISLEQKKTYEERLGFPLLENYGLSETTFISSETLSSRFRRSSGFIGEVLPWVEVRLNSKGEELEVKTPFLCEAEIFEDSGSIKEKTFDREAFWATGDMVEISGRKLIYKQRIKNIVKKGGYLISLDEIERLLEQVPDVSSACAVGIEHPFYGECITICMLASEKATVTKARQHLAENLSRYKWPSFFLFVDELPLTLTGKPDRKRLEIVAAEAAKRNEGEAF